MVKFRGRFRCQLKFIIDSWLQVHDPPGSGAGCRCTIHNLKSIVNVDTLFLVYDLCPLR